MDTERPDQPNGIAGGETPAGHGAAAVGQPVPAAPRHRTRMLIQALVLTLLSLGLYHLARSDAAQPLPGALSPEQAPSAWQSSDLRYLSHP